MRTQPNFTTTQLRSPAEAQRGATLWAVPHSKSGKPEVHPVHLLVHPFSPLRWFLLGSSGTNQPSHRKSQGLGSGLRFQCWWPQDGYGASELAGTLENPDTLEGGYCLQNVAKRRVSLRTRWSARAEAAEKSSKVRMERQSEEKITAKSHPSIVHRAAEAKQSLDAIGPGGKERSKGRNLDPGKRFPEAFL